MTPSPVPAAGNLALPKAAQPALSFRRPGVPLGIVGMPESETSFKAIPPSEMKGRRIGRIFVKMQLVKREQVSKALAVQKERAESGQKVKVGEVLRELGFVTDHHIAYAGRASRHAARRT